MVMHWGAVRTMQKQPALAHTVLGDVARQRLDDKIGEGDGAVGTVGFRWAEVGRPARQRPELPIDDELTSQEVDAVDREPARLTLSKPGAKAEIDAPQRTALAPVP